MSEKSHPAPSFIERLNACRPSTPAEQRVAACFEQEYPHLAFDNLATLSARAGVSQSSLTRFVQRMGYANFPQFSKELRDELSQSLDPLHTRYIKRSDRIQQHDNGPSVLQSYGETVLNNLRHTVDRNHMAHIHEAVDLLCQTERPLYVMGAASAQGLAAYFQTLAVYLRDDVTLLTPDISTLAHKLTRFTEQSVLLSIAYHRCSRVTYEMMRYFADKGAKIILITDRHATPLTRLTNIHLVACSDGGASMFNSRASGLFLLETLLCAMTPRLVQGAVARFERMEEVFTRLETFAHDINPHTPQERLDKARDFDPTGI